jgi:hypothetical protein
MRLAACARCGELNPSALMKRNGVVVCANCDGREHGRPERLCVRCDDTAPFGDRGYHPRGWRNSPETVDLCINCHRIVHALDMARTLRGEGASFTNMKAHRS